MSTLPDRSRREPFGRIPEWLLDDPGVSHQAKLLYAVLTRYGGSVFPGEPALARRVGCGERQIRRLISELERVKAMRVARTPGLRNVYELADNPGHGCPGHPGHGCPETPDISSTDPGHFATETPDTHVLLKREEREKAKRAAPHNATTPDGAVRRPRENPAGPATSEAYHLKPQPYLDDAGFYLGLAAELYPDEAGQ